MAETVLVTGASGMIGSAVVKGLLESGYRVIGVDRVGTEKVSDNFVFRVADLGDRERIAEIVKADGADRIIHLAALAHTAGEKDLSYERYYHVNVECAENVFAAAGKRPVLFISTVDVYGFTKGVVTAKTEPHPVTPYGKSKYEAEKKCALLDNYTIFRFSPVYTDTVKRDIQKRYYLKYPKIAYLIGKNTEYEILNVNKAVAETVGWCAHEPDNAVHIIKDEKRMNTLDYITAEKAAGRAKTVLHFPRRLVASGFAVLKVLTGKNKYTYLLNKAVNPLRTE